MAARQIVSKRPDISITTLHIWDSGRLLHTEDPVILSSHAKVGLTLATYDRKTIPPVLGNFVFEGKFHAEEVFVDEKTIAQNAVRESRAADAAAEATGKFLVDDAETRQESCMAIRTTLLRIARCSQASGGFVS